nr:NAD(P)-binding domain-containing protein [Cupriavidus sp. USMAHM13]
MAALGGRAQGLRAQPGAARMQPVGVIGAGHIGGTIGGLWVQAGHPVLFSSRHPDELRPLAQAGSVAQAIAFADVVLLAVPYKALPEIARDYGRALSGKVVIDATNAFRERDGDAGALALRDGIGITTARFLPGARVVRAFNFMAAAAFASESHHAGEPVAVPIAGDDPQALRVAKQLVRDAGFEPVVVGGRASADSFAPGGPLFHQIGSAQAMRERIARLPNPAGAR